MNVRIAAKWLVALGLTMLSAGAAQAQYSAPVGTYDTSGTNLSLLPDYEQTRSYSDAQRDREINRQYREVADRIPDKKGSRDPWKNIRQTPSQALDRHRPM